MLLLLGNYFADQCRGLWVQARKFALLMLEVGNDDALNRFGRQRYGSCSDQPRHQSKCQATQPT